MQLPGGVGSIPACAGCATESSDGCKQEVRCAIPPTRAHTMHNSIPHASCHVHILTARVHRALVQRHPRAGATSLLVEARILTLTLLLPTHTLTRTRSHAPTHHTTPTHPNTHSQRRSRLGRGRRLEMAAEEMAAGKAAGEGGWRWRLEKAAGDGGWRCDGGWGWTDRLTDRGVLD